MLDLVSRRVAVALVAVVADAYDFGLGGAVVDVGGGGQGATLAAILRRNPTLSGVLWERVLSGTPGYPLDHPEIRGRASVVAGHDWSDAKALDILRNCRRAMVAGAKLLVVIAAAPDCMRR